MRALPVLVLTLAVLGGCGPDYSPDTYSSTAVQQSAKVDRGVVVGVRPVDVSADSTLGTVTGGAAGAAAGSQVGTGVTSALSAVGGTLVGGLVGSGVAHTTEDTTAYEYIVRKINGDLVSVTQKDPKPISVGTDVLVIDGKQARIVPDYTVAVQPEKTEPPSSPATSSSRSSSPSAPSPPSSPAASPSPLPDSLPPIPPAAMD